MNPGSVDRTTGNVPLHLGGGYLLHYEGRDGHAFFVRLARSTTGPRLRFESATDLVAYVSVVAELVPAVSTEGIELWLITRTAEPSAVPA